MNNVQACLDEALEEVSFRNVDSAVIEDYDIEAEVCELIVTTRARLRVTQKQLAEKSGVSQANISKIENGSYRPGISILKRIANALGKRLVIEFEDVEQGKCEIKAELD